MSRSTAGAHHFIVDSGTAFNPKRAMELPLPLWKPIKHLNGGDTVITICKKLVLPSCWCDFHDFTGDSKSSLMRSFSGKSQLKCLSKPTRQSFSLIQNLNRNFKLNLLLFTKSRTPHTTENVKVLNETMRVHAHQITRYEITMRTLLAPKLEQNKLISDALPV